MNGRGFLGGVVTGVVLFASLQLAGQEARGQGALPRSETARGLAIAPVRLNLRRLNKRKVALGSYIVNAQSDCSGCHTNPPFAKGGNPFEGEEERINTTNYLAGGQAFGPFVSRNITPDERGDPAGLTLRQFIQLMRTGRDRAGNRLQVMPWPAFSKMTNQDLEAIYEYLRAIPSAEPGA